MTTELRRLRNYIDGEFRDAADGRTTDVVDPATGEPYATAPLSAAAECFLACLKDAIRAGEASQDPERRRLYHSLELLI